MTFGAPFKLNSQHRPTRPQWQPNLSVSQAGTLFATWYDARESSQLCSQRQSRQSPAIGCGRASRNDNGADMVGVTKRLSDVVSPLPLQGDPNIQPTYAGDYDYGSALHTKHVTSWTDGRVAISGASQQDAFTDRELVGFAVTTTTPACNSIISTQPVDFVINLSDAVNPATVQANDFTVNGTPANTVVVKQRAIHTITFHFNTSPVSTQGPQTMHIAAGAFNRASDNHAELRVRLHVLLRRNAANGDYDCAARRRHVHTARAWQL